MLPLPDASSAVEKRLADDYFDELGKVLWDSRQRHCFASYPIGLMSEVERKSLEPIAASLTDDPKTAERLHHRLQNFVADAPWPDMQVRRIAARYALCAMQKRAPVQTWICDDTSVGVQRQYCGALGKVANCQVAPSLVVATHYAHLPIDMTLYLGQKWADDAQRRNAAQIPDEVQFATKPALVLELIERAHAHGIPPSVFERPLVPAKDPERGPTPVRALQASTRQEQEVYDYSMAFTGIFGRNRTVKDHTVKLVKGVSRSEPKTLQDQLALPRRPRSSVNLWMMVPGQAWR